MDYIPARLAEVLENGERISCVGYGSARQGAEGLDDQKVESGEMTNYFPVPLALLWAAADETQRIAPAMTLIHRAVQADLAKGLSETAREAMCPYEPFDEPFDDVEARLLIKLVETIDITQR
jgi:hypothetical protein